MRSVIEMESGSTSVEKVGQLGMSLMKTIEDLAVADLALSIGHLRHVKIFAVMLSMAGHAGEFFAIGR